MYTKIKNVQIIVSLLKQHNIRHLVLSAGTRHVPLAHSVENDDFFKCYSVVDERSAGYFALGLSKELGEPVAIACTSSTATCNYTPAVAEAFYQKVPLLILTGDRDPYSLNQLEDQMIDQKDMYRNFCKKCVSLPVVKDERDEWYCQRLVNEALLELDHHGKGPVQINFPIVQSIEEIANAGAPELPMYNKIERCEIGKKPQLWEKMTQKLRNAKRIMVLLGAATPASKELCKAMDDFAERYNCVIATEPLSNLHCKNALNCYLMAESITVATLSKYAPDLVIFFGGNFLSRLKPQLKSMHSHCESWIINDDGAVMDPFMNLTGIFECDPVYFFRYFAEENPKGKNDRAIYNDFVSLIENIPAHDPWTLTDKVNQIEINDAKFKNLKAPSESELIKQDYLSSFLAMYGVSQRLPKNSLLHLSILNSTRITQMFPLDPSVAVYSNLGTDGIDGSMSTFLGQAKANPDRPAFLIIGDLSFFYDMNSLGIRDISPNVHILLVNNGGGAEFYFSMGRKLLPNIDLHIAAAHEHSAKAWIESNDLHYLTANDQQSYRAVLDDFMRCDRDRPVVLEIFTDKEKDIKILKGYRRLIQQKAADKLIESAKSNPIVQKMAQTEIGQNMKKVIKKFF